jgi:uncharacterized protein
MTPTQTYYPNGQIECEGFVNGELQVGSWTFYHENGKVFSKGQYDDNGKPVGVWTEYYENGQIKYEAISPQGNRFSFDNDNVQIINFWTEEGLLLVADGEGKLMTCFDNGNIEHVSHWTNKLKNGTLQNYYETGQLKNEINYRDGLKEGVGKTYHANGSLRSSCSYVQGRLSGIWREWYESGQLSEEGEYVDGKYTVVNFWLENGEQPLKNKTGKVIRKSGPFDADVREHHFDNGEFIEEKIISRVTYGKFIPNADEKNGL